MITDKHRNFAREVIALARKHQMTSLTVRFRNSISDTKDQPTSEYYEEVTLAWAEGRHGEQSNINLETRAMQQIPE